MAYRNSCGSPANTARLPCYLFGPSAVNVRVDKASGNGTSDRRLKIPPMGLSFSYPLSFRSAENDLRIFSTSMTSKIFSPRRRIGLIPTWTKVNRTQVNLMQVLILLSCLSTYWQTLPIYLNSEYEIGLGRTGKGARTRRVRSGAWPYLDSLLGNGVDELTNMFLKLFLVNGKIYRMRHCAAFLFDSLDMKSDVYYSICGFGLYEYQSISDHPSVGTGQR